MWIAEARRMEKAFFTFFPQTAKRTFWSKYWSVTVSILRMIL
jgi:hypothetical protein